MSSPQPFFQCQPSTGQCWPHAIYSAAMLRLGVLAAVLFIASSPSHGASTGLRVATDGRSFTDASGKPFLWLGDTAWMLFHATDRAEAELYLDTRARQGFTVIQAALVMGPEDVCGTFVPNRY